MDGSARLLCRLRLWYLHFKLDGDDHMRIGAHKEQGVIAAQVANIPGLVDGELPAGICLEVRYRVAALLVEIDIYWLIGGESLALEAHLVVRERRVIIQHDPGGEGQQDDTN